MKNAIHPDYTPIEIACSCGHTFTTRSTINKDRLQIEVCANCHPFYTGQNKVISTSGRIERFKQRYARTANTNASKD